MPAFPLVATPPPPATTPQEDLQSFTAMESAIEERQPPVVTTACARPVLELSLLDYTSAAPLPGSTFRVVIRGTEQTGELRQDGVAVIENAPVDLDALDIRVTWFSEPADGCEFLIELVPAAEEPEEEEEPLVYDDSLDDVWEPFGPPHEPDSE